MSTTAVVVSTVVGVNVLGFAFGAVLELATNPQATAWSITRTGLCWPMVAWAMLRRY